MVLGEEVSTNRRKRWGRGPERETTHRTPSKIGRNAEPRSEREKQKTKTKPVEGEGSKRSRLTGQRRHQNGLLMTRMAHDTEGPREERERGLR